MTTNSELVPLELERSFLQKVDRILAGKALEVVELTRGKELAYSTPWKISINFREVWFHASLSEPSSDLAYERYIALLKGLNYHELAHIFFTTIDKREALEKHFPEDFSKGWVSEKAKHFLDALNLLEDQRIENLFAATYPMAEKYFALIGLSLLPIDLSYLWGRRLFLPEKVTKAAEKKLVLQYGPQVLAEVKNIIDEYLVCRSKERQIELAKRFAELVGKIPPNKLERLDLAPQSTTAKQKKAEEEALKRLEESLTQKIQEEGKSENADSEDSGGGDGDGEKENTNLIWSEAILEKLADVADEIREDIRNIRRGSYSERDYTTSGGKSDLTPTDSDMLAARRLEDLLREIRSGLEPHYLRKMRSGRVDLRAAMRAGEQTRIFKKFKHDRTDKTRLAVGLLVDTSGSMTADANGTTKLAQALRSAWVLNRALERTGCKTCLIMFTTSHRIAKGWYGKADWEVKLCGGTDPASALSEAARQFSAIKRLEGISDMLLFLITDGQFQPSGAIKRLNRMGVQTCLVYIEGDDKDVEIYTHSCKYVIRVGNVEELPQKLSSMTEKIAMEIARRVKG